MPDEHLGFRFTVGIAGSFGVLRYALLAFSTSTDWMRTASPAKPQCPLTEDLLARGFRRTCNSGYADMALKAQPADGSILCRVSGEGLVSLVVDGLPVWSRHSDPTEEETVRWLKAAQHRGVVLISGDYLQITEAGIDATVAADKGTLVMARIPAAGTGKR